MKKLIVLFAFLFIALFSNAKLVTMQSTQFKVLDNGGWTPSDLRITWNTDTKRIIIYTYSPQIIDYVKTDTVEDSEAFVLYGEGTDTNYKVVTFYFILKEGQPYLTMKYSNITYSYKVTVLSK